MQRPSFLPILLAVVLIVITLPVYFTIAGMSLLAFDASDTGARDLLVSGLIIGFCLFVPFGSLFQSVVLIRRERLKNGLLVSIIPVLALMLLWFWMERSSFG